jgi:hypothetical protein
VTSNLFAFDGNFCSLVPPTTGPGCVGVIVSGSFCDPGYGIVVTIYQNCECGPTVIDTLTPTNNGCVTPRFACCAPSIFGPGFYGLIPSSQFFITGATSIPRPISIPVTLNNSQYLPSSVSAVLKPTLNANGTVSWTADVTFSKISTPLALRNLVQSMGLDSGITRALSAKLDAAQADLDAGDKTSACNMINAFINQVNAQTGNKLTTAQAGQLLSAANLVKSAMGCP